MLLKPSNMTNTYNNSGHGNDDGKVNYVADNNMPQQMAFHGVVRLDRCQIVPYGWNYWQELYLAKYCFKQILANLMLAA